MRIRDALEEFTEDYLHYQDRSKATQENYELATKSFIRSQGNIPVEKIELRHVIRWKADMKRSGIALSTIRNYMSKIKNLLKFTNKQGWSNFDLDEIILPVVKVRFAKHLTEEEIERLISVSDTRDSAIIALLYASGLRVGELVSLDRTDALTNEFTVIGKGSKQRPAFMNSQAKAYLNMYLATRTDKLDPLFISCRKTRIRIGDVQRIVKAAAERAGIEKRVTPHILRHSFATNMLQKGCDIRFLQEMLGHADVSTTQLYTHVTKPALQMVYQKFNS